MKYGIQILIWMLLTTFYLAANELSIYSVSAQDKKAKLLGPDANLQLVVYNSDLQDMTREVVYTSAPDNLISISDSGKVIPLGNGDVTITATDDKGLTGKLDLVVERFETPQPINFPNEIVPLFTKHGCNGEVVMESPRDKMDLNCHFLVLNLQKTLNIWLKSQEVEGCFPLRQNTVYY